MWPSLRDRAIMMSLVLCVGLAAAAEFGLRNSNGAAASFMDDTTGSLARFQAKWTLASLESALTQRLETRSDAEPVATFAERALEAIGRRRGALSLGDAQRSRIYESVMKIPDAPVAVAPAPDLADALPSGVPLQDLPAAVTQEIPLVQGHKFVKLDDRILVINPASRRVVAMIPRYKLLQ